MTASINTVWERIQEPVFNTIKVFLLERHVEDILYHYSNKLDYLVKRYARSLPPFVADSEIDDLSTLASLEFLETIKVWNPAKFPDIWPLAQARIIGAMKDHIRYLSKSDPSRFYDWITDAAYVYMASTDRADFEHRIETGVQLTQAMKVLSPREKQVVVAHAKDDQTFKQIGIGLNISESQISRIYKKAIEKIKKTVDKPTHV
jgi:RNA polymerase sigma factor (sigma-70 family)